jgi:putative ABC transport system ATP-binding protein
LLNSIGCLDTLSAGEVIYDGKELGRMDEKQLTAYRKVSSGFIFQSHNLIPVLTVREKVELPMVIEKKWSKREMAVYAFSALNGAFLELVKQKSAGSTAIMLLILLKQKPPPMVSLGPDTLQ